MLITNAIRVKIKEAQMPIFAAWLADEKNKTSSHYEVFKKLAADLPEETEHFRGLAELDKRAAANPSFAAKIVRLNHKDEHMEDLIKKYQDSENEHRNEIPLRREHIKIYEDILAEMMGAK